MVARPVPDQEGEHRLIALSDDQEMTLAFQRGDKGSYQAIYDRYSTRVHSVCRRMLVNPEDAAEASQEVFLRVYQGLGRFNGRYQLGAWITRVATNVCLDQLRMRSRRGHEVNAFEDWEHDAPCDTKDLPEEVTVRRSEGRRVRKVLQTLPPMHRAAIILRDFEGLSYQEVADALQISDTQVKALLHRARQRFKRDWIGPVAAFLPWRLMQKFRGGEHIAREPGLLGTAAQVAPTCSTAMQHCGQYVLEKLAPVLTVALVTSTAVAPIAPALEHPTGRASEPAKRTVEAATVANTGFRRGLADERTQQPQPAQRSTTSEREAEQGQAAVPEAAPTPAPTPTPAPSSTPEPTPSPSPTDAGGAGQGSGEMAGPAAPRGPFAPTIGFDWGRAIPSRMPTAHYSKADCSTLSLTQRTETVVDDDDSAVTYPALVLITASESSVSIEVTVWKNGTEVYYSGSGELIAQDNSDPAVSNVRYSGRYGTFNQQASSMDLPANGRFSLDVGLDCARRQLATESFRLHV